MKQLWYSFKYVLFVFWTLIQNAYFYFRYYCKALRNKFNRDYTSDKTKSGFQISFEDDFNGTDIDWTKWNKWNSMGNGQDRSNTPAISSLDCLRVENGLLYLTTEKNTDPQTSEFPLKCGVLYSQYDSWCENGTEMTKGYEQNYGYYEIRCKVPPQGKLFWPAFWLWGQTWPPEIDIFEFMSTEDIGTSHTKGISMTTHWGYQGKQNSSNYFGSQIGRTYRKLFGISVNWDENYHVYACNWTPQYIDFYIDDVRVYRNIYNVPSNKMSIQINITGYNEQLPKDSDLPGVYIVDYVRAYKIS